MPCGQPAAIYYIKQTVKTNQMLNIKKFVCNMFQENCYVVSDETGDCVIIDCGAHNATEKRQIEEYISGSGLTPRHLLCTHAHIDHNFGNGFIFSTYGMRPTLCRADEQLYDMLPQQAVSLAGMNYDGGSVEPGCLMDEGSHVDFGSHRIDIILTPGHSPGSAFLYCKDEQTAFSGDTLFRMSIGRTDLPGGDYNGIMESLRRITTLLPEETVVYPGHGPNTTIREERLMNPFF